MTMTKLEENIFRLELSLYNIAVVCAVGKEAFNRLNELYTPVDEEYKCLKEPAQNIPACTWERMKDKDGYPAILVWFKDDFSLHKPMYSSHEASHVAMYVWQHIGAKIDLDNQEPFAYLVGFVNCKFAEVFERNYKNTNN